MRTKQHESEAGGVRWFLVNIHTGLIKPNSHANPVKRKISYI